jgi:signal transduction histidine kinase
MPIGCEPYMFVVRLEFNPGDLVGTPVEPLSKAEYVTLRGTHYRGLSAPILQSDPPISMAVLTPRTSIDNVVSSLRERFLLFAFLALGIVALIAWLLGRTIVRSLRELADAAGAVSRGHFGQRVEVHGRDEFATLGRAFNEMSGQLAAERGRVQDAVDRFGKALAATHDRGLAVEIATPLARVRELAGLLGDDPSARATLDRLADELAAHEEFLAVDLDPGREYAVNVVNAPVFDHTGHVTLVLSLTGFARALHGTEVRAAGDALVAATSVITDALSPTPARTPRS